MFPERACLADLGENDEGRRTTSASTWRTWTCTLSHTPHINQEKKRYTHSILSERLFRPWDVWLWIWTQCAFLWFPFWINHLIMVCDRRVAASFLSYKTPSPLTFLSLPISTKLQSPSWRRLWLEKQPWYTWSRGKTPEGVTDLPGPILLAR